MFRDFNDEFPKMRPLAREVYGKLFFLSGAENKTLRDQIYAAGARNICLSFHYLRGKRTDIVRKELERFEHVILHAGVHDYISQAKKGQKMSVEEIKYYADDYREFAESLADSFNWVFEMDATVLVSDQYRRDNIDEMLDRGVRIVPIIQEGHFARVEDFGYLELAERTGMLAIPPRMTEAGNLDTSRVLDGLAKRGVLVHGMNASDEGSINRMPYFSADSPSWLAGTKYGITYVYDEYRLQTFPASQKKEIREHYRRLFLAAGLDVEGILADEAGAVNGMNAYAWKTYAEHTGLSLVHSFWLSDREKARGKDEMRKMLGQGPGAETKFLAAARDADFIRRQPLQSMLPEGVSPYLDPRMAIPMMCDSCQISRNCPAYQETALCHFANTMDVQNIDDMVGVTAALTTMQYTRIAHMRMAETFRGGVADPAISDAIEDFAKLGKTFSELEKTRIKKQGPAGMLGPGKGAEALRGLMEDEEDTQHAPSQTKPDGDEDDFGDTSDDGTETTRWPPQELFE